MLKRWFPLNKWISNDRAMISEIPEEDRAKEMRTLDLNKDLNILSV